MAIKAKGIVIPIAIFAPVEIPCCPGFRESCGGELVAVGNPEVDEDWAVLVGVDELEEDVMSEADERIAKSELCHHIGIPSQLTVVAVLTELEVMLPWSMESPACVG